MLTQMDIGGVMACAHGHAPQRKRTSPMFASGVHKCTGTPSCFCRFLAPPRPPAPTSRTPGRTTTPRNLQERLAKLVGGVAVIKVRARSLAACLLLAATLTPA